MSEPESTLLHLPHYTQSDLQRPVEWLEQLSFDSLMIWLRRALFVGNPRPVIVPPNARLASHLGRVFKSGSAHLRSQLGILLPLLLQEWSNEHGAGALENLLVLAGALRCAAAQDILADLARHRLGGLHPDEEVRLRQRCLSVLAGIARGPRMRYVFRGYLDEFPYAATCYRALYLNHLPDAATELPRLLKVYQQRGAIDDLVRVLRLFLFYELRNRPRDLQEIARQLLESAPEDELRYILDIVQRAGYVVEPNLRYGEPESVYLRNINADDPLEFGIGPIGIETLDERRLAILLDSPEVDFLNYLNGIMLDSTRWEDR